MMSTPPAGTVTGRFLAPTPEAHPLTGQVIFTPRPVMMRTADAVYLPAPVTATLDEEGHLVHDGSRGVDLLAPGEGVEPSEWTWHVRPWLRFQGQAVHWGGFDVQVTAGETVDLTEATPAPDPVTGEYVTRGEPGEPGEPGRDGRDALMLAPDPVTPGLYVMVSGALPVDQDGLLRVSPVLTTKEEEA